jgi:hypothetical protein
MFDRISIQEVRKSLIEMREVSAALFRIIFESDDPNLVDKFEAEMKRLQIKEGFGVRCQEAIKKLPSGESTGDMWTRLPITI